MARPIADRVGDRDLRECGYVQKLVEGTAGWSVDKAMTAAVASALVSARVFGGFTFDPAYFLFEEPLDKTVTALIVFGIASTSCPRRSCHACRALKCETGIKMEHNRACGVVRVKPRKGEQNGRHLSKPWVYFVVVLAIMALLVRLGVPQPGACRRTSAP
ncbi:MAG: hypothetical protein MZV64_19290 [Ignavibacteriales bacterium]|nr:hypothetical protein [Ignavibacteriales bacterium]